MHEEGEKRNENYIGAKEDRKKRNGRAGNVEMQW